MELINSADTILKNMEIKLDNPKIDEASKQLIFKKIKSIKLCLKEIGLRGLVRVDDNKNLNQIVDYLTNQLKLLNNILENPEADKTIMSDMFMKQLFSRDYMLANAGMIVLEEGDSLYNILSKYNILPSKAIDGNVDKTMQGEVKIVNRKAQLLVKLKQIPGVEVGKDNIPKADFDNISLDDQLLLAGIAMELISLTPNLDKPENAKLLASKNNFEAMYKNLNMQLMSQIPPKQAEKVIQETRQIAKDSIKEPSLKDGFLNWFDSLSNGEKIMLIVVGAPLAAAGVSLAISGSILGGAALAGSGALLATSNAVGNAVTTTSAAVTGMALKCSDSFINTFNALPELKGGKGFLLALIPHANKIGLNSLVQNNARQSIGYVFGATFKDVVFHPATQLKLSEYKK